MIYDIVVYDMFVTHQTIHTIITRYKRDNSNFQKVLHIALTVLRNQSTYTHINIRQ